MTENSLKSISPDGITGMIFALEGIKNSVVLLNGPMGCKFYHSSISQRLMPRPRMYIPQREGEEPSEVNFSNLNNWFFRQGRVPCTWLDSHDYVYGTAGKVEEALRFIRQNVSCDLIAVVNSPGASLIGDDLRQLAGDIFPDIPAVVLETPGFSRDYWDGTDEAIKGVLMQAGGKLRDLPQKETGRPSVNIIGMSLWQKYSEGNILELRRLFGLCGIDITCVLCAGCSIDDIRKVPSADLNIVIYPELGKESAEWLEKNTGMPALILDAPPVGFDATAEMIGRVADMLGADTSAFREELERARAWAWYKLDQIHSASGRPNGTLFAVKSIPSEERAYERFFTDYLGMIRTKGDPGESDAELVFADANTIAELMLKRMEFCGIEIANPSMGYVDVVNKSTLGISGALFLTEQVINGFMTRMV